VVTGCDPEREIANFGAASGVYFSRLMNATIARPEAVAVVDSSAIQVTIIYDEFLGGARAKHFAERLAQGVGFTCRLSESLWRGDMLECPSVAGQASAGAADCDYLIVSWRGDRVLPDAACRWIEGHLRDAAWRGMGLIALIQAGGNGSRLGESGEPQAEGGARHFLRSLCTEHDVAFFCHSTPSRVERAAAGACDEDESAALNFNPTNPTCHDSIHRC
jgi:hypothetical protein